MLTPQKIQDLADPIESIYIAMTNELMVNIGRHITSPNWTHTAAWEIQKLSELGQLTAENAAIINNWIAQIPDEIRDTMEETRRIALEGIEQDLSKAADKGYLTPPMRDSTYDVLNEYGQQAADKLNMVNTTMLESSVEMYKRGIAMVMSEEQAAAAQNILNEETGAVVSGTETRTQALQRAIGRMNDEGITGFYDRAGRSWSAEAYVNMDIRTTVHNTAIQSVKNRMNDYGAQVFQVSAHVGARPLCYPYQGKMYSWDNTSGEIEDGNGKRWKYAPLNSTSYGQAAGLFGVNCGHSPIPIIPGVSIPHAQDYVQPKSENDKAYAESQEQRALERKIRSAKRAIEMGDDSPEAKQRLKDAQKDMRQFINETGRTRRYDRESLYGGKKAPKLSADQRAQNNSAVNSQTTTNNSASVNNGIKQLAFTTGNQYTIKDVVKTEDPQYAFGNGTSTGIRKTEKATIYELPDGMRFVFPKRINSKHQTLTVSELIDAYNRVPQEIKAKGQRLVVVQDVYNPQDSYWKKVYKNFPHSYATGGDEITFWRYDYAHDPDYLVRTFEHEMGHYIDRTTSQYPGKVSSSADWQSAMADDITTSGKTSPTTYGENAPVEDFAESIAELASDINLFKKSFPNRFNILEQILI